MGSVNAGIVVRSPVKGDIDRNGLLQIDDAVKSLQIMTGLPLPAQSYAVDINRDGKIGIPETIFILQGIVSMQ
ncbi:hypothetical protein [Desulfonema limicola]|uniref:hypothetical protein n=1 Tax=Desulfonema limicola TaxID=45656 RepID=UPI001A9BA5A2|nr:hypothetical protein [Desulfonema limicola]